MSAVSFSSQSRFEFLINNPADLTETIFTAPFYTPSGHVWELIFEPTSQKDPEYCGLYLRALPNAEEQKSPAAWAKRQTLSIRMFMTNMEGARNSAELLYQSVLNFGQFSLKNMTKGNPLIHRRSELPQGIVIGAFVEEKQLTTDTVTLQRKTVPNHLVKVWLKELNNRAVSDVEFNVQGEIIYARSSILRRRSKYFEMALQSRRWSESSTGSCGVKENGVYGDIRNRDENSAESTHTSNSSNNVSSGDDANDASEANDANDADNADAENKRHDVNNTDNSTTNDRFSAYGEHNSTVAKSEHNDSYEQSPTTVPTDSVENANADEFSDITLDDPPFTRPYSMVSMPNTPITSATPMHPPIRFRIDVPDFSPNTFTRFLEFLYTDQAVLDSVDRALDMLTVADKYLVPELRQRAKDALVRQLTEENAAEILFDRAWMWPDVKDEVVGYVVRNFSVIRMTSGFKRISLNPTKYPTFGELWVEVLQSLNLLEK